jgi:quinol monooxygenase YgiN
MTDSVVIVATFFPKPGLHDSVHAVIAAAQTNVIQEDGCLLYALHESDDRFVLIEKWASLEAIKTHAEGENLAKLVKDVEPFLAAELEIVQLTPVGHDAHPAAGIKGVDG